MRDADGLAALARPTRTDARIAVDRAFVDAVRGIGDDIRVPYAEALRTHAGLASRASPATDRPAGQRPVRGGAGDD